MTRRAIKTPRKGKGSPKPPITWQTASCEATRTGWRFVMPVVVSANRQWRRGKTKTGKVVTYKPKGSTDDARAAAALFGRCGALDGDLTVRILWVRKQATGDVDNRVKATLDLLKGIAFADDKQVRRVEIERSDDPTTAPGLYVEVEPYRPAMMRAA